MVGFLRKLFCKHEWEVWDVVACGELWGDYLYKCKKCNKVKGMS